VPRLMSFLFLFLSPWLGGFGCGGGNSDSGRTTQSNGEVTVTHWVFDLLEDANVASGETIRVTSLSGSLGFSGSFLCFPQ
jgi:hypothetical protein